MSRVRNLFRVRKSSRRRPTAALQLEHLESRLAPSANVLAYDYGNTGDTGANTNETQLTPANVNTSYFGKLFQTSVDGQVYAEPLVMEGVSIGPFGSDSAVNLVGPIGMHNVVFVGTEHDSLYAIDTATGAILWQRSFTNINAAYVGTTIGSNLNNTLGATSITSIPAGDYGSANITPEFGITSTPVIDPNSGTLYVTVPTKQTIGGVASWVQQLHGININDGTDKLSPFTIGVTDNKDGANNHNTTPIWTYGTGDGNVTDPNAATDGNPGTKIVQFNAIKEMNRPALSFENGQVYVAWASHGDHSPYHGWVATWKPTGSTLTLTGVFCSSPNNGLSGIWASGGAIQFEPDGSAFYFETGNGSGGNPTLDANGFPTNHNYNEALVKMVADSTTSASSQGPNGWGMKVADYFIPNNVSALDAADADFGSGAPLLLPASAGIPGHPNLILAAGKSGTIYVIDRNNMGHFNATTDNVISETANNAVVGSLSTPAYYNGHIYWTSGYNGPAFEYQISSAGVISAVSQSASTMGTEPGSIEISANGNLNGVVWVMDRSLTEIHAYDASTLSTELWNSGMKAGGGDNLDSVVLFAAPTVADGEVFVGGMDGIAVFGENAAPTAVPNPPALSATALTGSSINLNWTDASALPNRATSYAVEESIDGTNFRQVSTAPAGATSVAIGGLSPTTTYYFRIRGQDGLGYSSYSNVASATTTSQVPGLNLESQFALNGSAALSGSSLELTTSGTVNEAASAFVTTAVDVTSFQTQFTFQTTAGSGTAEGLTFALQGISPTAIGASGGALGYGPQVGGGNAGIGSSVAVKFDLNSNAGEGADSTGLYIDGAAPTTANSIDLSSTGIDLHSGHVFRVNMNYNGTTLTVTITDTMTNAAATQNYTIGIPSTIGSSAAYVGFTGSTGAQTATQDLLTWTYTPTVAASPNAPSGLGAVPATANSVALSWNTNSDNQTSFNLDRATDPGFTQNLITENLPATPSSFTDTAAGLMPGGIYYYRLRAFNSAGNSGNSNVASVAIPLPPPAPTNPEVLSVSSSEIDLQWTDNAGHNTEGYKIYRAANHGSFMLVTVLPPTSRTAPDAYGYDDTSFSPGTFYEYQIICYNTSGNNGPADISVNSLTAAPNLAYVQQSGSTATLYFTSPTGATSYNIYRSTATGAETLFKSGVSASPYADATLSAGTTYYYYVTAVNANLAPVANESMPSNEVSPGVGPVVALNPSALPAGTANGIYNQTITASGGTGPLLLTVANIANPIPGLNLPASGSGAIVITGTPTATGTETFTVTATDATGATGTANYSITVNPSTVYLSMPTSGFTGATGGTIANFPININALQDQATANHVGLAAATLVVTFPARVFNFPIGSNLATADVSLGSVPLSDMAGPGGAGDWTLTANSTADGQLFISLSAKSGDTITTDSPAMGGSLVVINFPVSATYSPASPTVETIKVVSGLGSTHTFIIGNNGTYILNPRPSYIGNITINPVILITTTTLPAWTAAQAGYSQPIGTVGGTGPYNFAATGALPPGLTLSNEGVLNGTPTTAGSYAFTITATDSQGFGGTQTCTLTINPQLTIMPPSLADGAAGVEYTQTITSTGGTGSPTFSAAVAGLPPGLFFGADGVLRGRRRPLERTSSP